MNNPSITHLLAISKITKRSSLEIGMSLFTASRAIINKELIETRNVFKKIYYTLYLAKLDRKINKTNKLILQYM